MWWRLTLAEGKDGSDEYDQQSDHIHLAELLGRLARLGFAGYVSNLTCNRCHQLPMGASGAINDRFRVNRSQPAINSLAAANPPQLRGLWTKLADLADLSEGPGVLEAPVTGYGLDHTGSHKTLF